MKNGPESEIRNSFGKKKLLLNDFMGFDNIFIKVLDLVEFVLRR